jgi:hypothetical protein
LGTGEVRQIVRARYGRVHHACLIWRFDANLGDQVPDDGLLLLGRGTVQRLAHQISHLGKLGRREGRALGSFKLSPPRWRRV